MGHRVSYLRVFEESFLNADLLPELVQDYGNSQTVRCREHMVHEGGLPGPQVPCDESHRDLPGGLVGSLGSQGCIPVIVVCPWRPGHKARLDV